MTSPMVAKSWDPDSWRSRTAAQAVEYEDEAELQSAVSTLRQLPPLVTSFEIEKL
ncbi:MAG: 3-deoxy-7-phosphoheptulonate synthase, partial [Sandaracinus sp.]|nr:3-deoxy-7-phosphoheptulonate synthase [Sandaracinus sp.]